MLHSTVTTHVLSLMTHVFHCTFYVCLPKSNFFFQFQLHLRFVGVVNHSDFSYREFGLINYWALNIKGANNNYMKPYFRNDGHTSDVPTKLTVMTLTGAFYLLLVGLILATVTFLGECLIAVHCSNENRVKVIFHCV